MSSTGEHQETAAIVGRSVRRKDGYDNVRGKTQFADDIVLPGMLFGATVRSRIPRGLIKAIEFAPGIPWHEFTIVRAEDIPGKNCISLIVDDQPCLADLCINHSEEPILLLAHPDRCLLELARSAVHVETELLPPMLSMEDSLRCTERVWGNDNVFKKFVIEKGDVDSVWSAATFVIEGEYTTGAQEQLYLETNGVIARASSAHGITVWGSMQCPYYVHKCLTHIFGWKDEMVRVIQTATGGGFGGKEEYPSIIAAHAALLAWKSGKPVKLIYDRAEDMAATTKRHPARIRHRTAVAGDGRLLGMDVQFTIDGGAYATLSPVVLSRGAIHATGPYSCPNVRVTACAVATNSPPHGAFRGFGAPQTLFAVERQMNKVAAMLGLPPEEIRRRNFLCSGRTTATGQMIREDIDLDKLLKRALAESDYYAKQALFNRENPNRTTKRGMGFASFFHGAGFTGSGERYLASVVTVEANEKGEIQILTSGVEMGQGTNTILAQIAAERLLVPLERVDVARPDTASVPNSGPTVASRTTMIIGRLVEQAAMALRKMLQTVGLLGQPYSVAQFNAACRAYIRQHGLLRASAQYEPPPGPAWNEDKHEGDAYGTFAWAAYVAEVSIDITTYQVRVEEFTAVQEVGRVIHPVLASGQIEGGIVQGIGYALYEKVIWKNGRMENCQMTDYNVPTAGDAPRIRVVFEENGYPHGPLGAKGIGELPIDGPAPAILNAIENAIGVSLTSLPVTPEVLMEALEEQYAQKTDIDVRQPLPA